ncbi:hypothetical protein MMC08_005573 [Hypocenomyce scalaris]|nr:hypothetical protein [Hypocenomyce scalaris]
MYDPFQRLPAPIHLMIIKLVPDFSSLYHLVQASTSAAGILEECYSEVAGALISRFPRELQQVICAVAVALANSSIHSQLVGDDLSTSFEQFLKLSIHEKTRNPIPSDIPASAIGNLVCLACKIHQVAAMFLKTHIDRVNSLEPMHLLNPTHRFFYDPFRDYPKGRRYTPQQTGAASWAEEYRVVRALWRLQLYCVLRQGPVWPSSGEASDNASNASPDHGLSRVWGHLQPWEIDEMECIQDYLDEIHISLREPVFQVPERSVTLRPQSSVLVDAATAAASSILAEPPTDVAARVWHQDQQAAEHTSDGYNFFHTYGLRSPMSPLKESAWQPFRRLGFGIWDRKRMVALEMFRALREVYSPSDGEQNITEVGIRMSINNVCFTWHSIEGSQEGQ